MEEMGHCRCESIEVKNRNKQLDCHSQISPSTFCFSPFVKGAVGHFYGRHVHAYKAQKGHEFDYFLLLVSLHSDCHKKSIH